jgi:hypothetical protein
MKYEYISITLHFVVERLESPRRIVQGNGVIVCKHGVDIGNGALKRFQCCCTWAAIYKCSVVCLFILENGLVEPVLHWGGLTTLGGLTLDLWNLALVC